MLLPPLLFKGTVELRYLWKVTFCVPFLFVELFLKIFSHEIQNNRIHKIYVYTSKNNSNKLNLPVPTINLKK